MEKMLLPAIVSMMLSVSAVGQDKLETGAPFPQVKGELLTGGKVTLPAYGKGKVTMLAMGFTYDSRFSVEAYSNRFKSDFGNEPRCTFFEMPMLGGMAKMGKWFIESGMRRGTKKELHRNVITVYSGVDAWKKMTGYKEGNEAYLFLLDSEGRIVWMRHGGFSEDKYLEMKAAAGKLLAGS